MNETIRLVILFQPNDSKPSKASHEQILLSQQEATEIHSDQLAELFDIIGNEGCSFFPGTHNCNGYEGISKDKVETSQMLVLDFDAGITPEAVNVRLSNYGLSCNLIHRTFSDEIHSDETIEYKLNNCSRFRVLFLLDEEVNPEIFEMSLQYLYQLFPEADKRSIASFYYGGKEVLFSDVDYRMDLNLLHQAVAESNTINCKVSKTRRKNIKQFINSSPLHFLIDGNLNNRIDNGEKNANSIYIIKAKTKKSPLRISGWAAQMKEVSVLVADFMDCRRKLLHYELRGLYLSFRKFQGGELLWKNSVIDNPKIDDLKVDSILGYIKDWEAKTGMQYHEEKIINFAPDDPAAETYHKLSHIVSQKSRKAMPICTDDFNQLSLREARFGLDYLFNHALSKWEEQITVLKVATGVGKSYQISLSKHLAECVIACPTHKLAAELSSELVRNGIEHNLILNLPELPTQIMEKYNAYLAIGAYEPAANYLRSLTPNEILRCCRDLKKSKLLQTKLEEYFHSIDNAINDTLPVVCTHKRMINTNFHNHSVVIFDEDIVNSLGEVGIISMAGIRKAASILSSSEYTNLRRFLLKLIEMSVDGSHRNKECRIDQFYIDDVNNRLVESKIASVLYARGLKENILSLIRADYFTIEPLKWNDLDGEQKICFIKRNDLPNNHKYIIMSATADEFIFKKLFLNVEFYDLSNVKMVGDIIQFSNRSFSRNSFNDQKTEELAEKIADFAGDKPVITFCGPKYSKFYNNTFRHLEDIYGTNLLEGQDIVIVGTPHKPLYYYRLWAALLGVEYSSEELSFAKQKCQKNGFEFSMVTFQNADLQRIQFYFIESNLVQAVGRSRILANEATVFVFSSYPMKGATSLILSDMDSVKNSRQMDNSDQHLFSGIRELNLVSSGSMAS